MADSHFETRFAAAPERVFAVLSDPVATSVHLRHVQALVWLTPGPVGLGSRFRETRRVFGRESTQELTISRFEPPTGITMAVEKPSISTASNFDLTPDGAGTRVRVGIEVRGHTLGGKLFAVLLFPLMARAIQSAVRNDLEDLRATIEGRGGAASGEDGLPDSAEEARS